MTTKSKILLAILVATIILSGLVLWYFSAIRTYDLSLGRKYSYHLNYRNTAKSTIALPGVEAQSNSGDMTCEMKWDLVPLRIDEDIYTIAVFPAPAGECRFVFNDKDLLDDAAFRERKRGQSFILRFRSFCPRFASSSSGGSPLSATPRRPGGR